MRNDLSALDTALALLARGQWPVALHPLGAMIGTKDDPKVAKGKEPMGGNAWGLKPPTEAGLRKTFQNHPDAGVGQRLGREGGVVDIEVDGPEGEASLLKLFGGEVIETMGWLSQRGQHRLFSWDDRFAEIDPKRRAKFTLPGLPGLEFRFGQDKQAQSACPPTLGENGEPRRWNDVDDIAPLPEAAIQYLARALAQPKPSESNGRASYSRPVVEASDPAVKWFSKALEGEAGKVAMAQEGTRHDTLLSAARTLGGQIHHGYLTEAEVIAELTRAAHRSGLPEQETAATIRDGLKLGAAEPLPWPDRLSRPNPRVVVHDCEPDEDEGWGLIRFGSLPPAAPFPLDVLPPPARDLAEAAAVSIACPVDFVAVAILAAASGIIGRSVSLLIKAGYLVSASLYVALVGSPSSGKSPALRAALQPLWRIGQELYDLWRPEMNRWQESKPDDRGDEPVLSRIVSTDATTEALAPILAKSPRGLTITPDEMTKWVLSMDQYKGGKGGDRPFYLSAWNSEPIFIDRAKHMREPIAVPHPFLTVVGGMTPDMLSSLPEGKGRDDGFMARLLFSFPERTTRRYSENGIPKEVADEWNRMATALWKRDLRDHEGKEMPYVVRLTPEAAREWKRWCESHYAEQEADDFPESMEGPWGKLDAYAARLALILHLMHLAADPTAATNDDPPDLPEWIIKDAGRLVEYFKSHAMRVHASMGGKESAGGDDVQSILRWIMRGNRATFSIRDVNNNFDRFKEDEAALADALRWMIDHNLIRNQPEPEQNARGGRKRSPSFDVNPALSKSLRFRRFLQNPTS